MAVPNFYNTSFDRLALGVTADVASILAGLTTILTASLPVADRWVESPAGTFTSPPDPITGYTMTVIVSRVTALRMSFQCKDQNGVSIWTGEMDIQGTDPVTIWAGPKHLYIEGNPGTGGTPVSFALAAMVDPSPEAPNAPSVQVFTKTSHTTGGGFVFFFYQFPDRMFAIDGEAGGTPQGRFSGPWYAVNTETLTLFTAGGSEVAFPVAANIYPDATFGHNQHVGLVYQFAWVDRSHIPGSVVQIPIDVGVVGSFEVTYFLPQNNNVQAGRLAIRRP